MQGSVLTVDECAAALKVSESDILGLIISGELRAKKIGVHYRIPTQYFDEYLDLPLLNTHKGHQTSINFSEWADKWLELYKKPYVTENTYLGTYLLYVEKHLKPYFEKFDLCDIDPATVQRFLTSKMSLSESSLHKIVLCLNGIFETAIHNSLCEKKSYAVHACPK